MLSNVWAMNMKWVRVNWKPGAVILKNIKGTSPSDGRIAIKSTHAFISYGLRRDLELIQLYLEEKLAFEIVIYHAS